MFLSQLADSEGLGLFVLRQPRYILWRTGQLFAKQHFGNPVASENRARARCARLFCKGCAKSKNAAASKLLHAIDAPPILASYARYAVVFSEALVEEGVVCIQNGEHRG